jgi:probable rRNA maturation factor
MGVAVFVADEQHDYPVDAIRWLRLAEQVLNAEGVHGNAELSVLFVDEQGITDLNARFSSIEGPTDVLAFPIDEEPAEGGRSPDSGGSGPGYTPSEPADLPTLLGDVVICPHVAARNAPEHEGTYDDEIALLLVHGILHLMGMDHLDDDEAESMEARERELLGRFHRPPEGVAAGGDPVAPSSGRGTTEGDASGREPGSAPAAPGANA